MSPLPIQSIPMIPPIDPLFKSGNHSRRHPQRELYGNEIPSIAYMRNRLLRLYRCPLHNDTPSDCKVHSNCSHTCSEEEWFKYILGLDDNEITNLYFNHHGCLMKKVNHIHNSNKGDVYEKE